jgi:glycerophosphoryl diester phosphodiesterase
MSALPGHLNYRGRRVLLKYHCLLSGSGRHPPNSLAALEEVLEGGAEVVEIDLRLAADDRYVLLHDPTLERETSGRGAAREMDSQAFQRLSLRGGDVPGATFEEAIVRLLSVARPLKLQLDLKEGLPLEAAGLEALALGILRLRANPHLRIVVGCLADWNLRALKSRLPHQALGVDFAWHLDAPLDEFSRLPTRVNAYGYLDDHPLGFRRLLPVARYLEDRFETLIGLIPDAAEFYLRRELLAQTLADGFNPIAFLHARRPGCVVDIWTIDPDTQEGEAALHQALEAGANQITTNLPLQAHALINA